MTFILQMASDESSCDYNEVAYEQLSDEDKLAVLRPKKLKNLDKLKRVWRRLYDVEASGKLLDSWIKYLPAGYEGVLPEYVVTWLWHGPHSLDCNVVPDALEGDWVPNLIGKATLYTLHVLRMRANAKKVVEMSEYARKYLCSSDKMITTDCKHVDDDRYFEEIPKRGEKSIFAYSAEGQAIIDAVLIRRDRYGSQNVARLPLALRYVLEKWRSGTWTTYKEGCTALLEYALSLVEHFYRQHNRHSLSESAYYSDTSKLQWTPGTVFVPQEVRELVEVAIECLPDTPNAQFLRNYYKAASEHILLALHDKAAREALGRGSESKCCIQ